MAESSLNQVEGVEESISIHTTGTGTPLVPADDTGERSPSKITVGLAAKAVAAILLDSSPLFSFHSIQPSGEGQRRSREQRKSDLVKELIGAGIDPLLFDSLLTNELDRRLKIRFGVAFLTLTSLFTATSYGIVVFSGIYGWNISPTALTGLVIETPIQFIGLLYIIARNLFPDGRSRTSTLVRHKRSALKAVKERSE